MTEYIALAMILCGIHVNHPIEKIYLIDWSMTGNVPHYGEVVYRDMLVAGIQ